MPGVILRTELQSETVVPETREDVQVYVEDFLHGSLAISKEEIHAFTRDAARSECSGRCVTKTHEIGRLVGINISKVRGMPHRNDEDMPEIDRPNVHEGGVPVVSIDKAGWKSTLEDSAEDALVHSVPCPVT
jgi:hypothetical protein